jgi:alpha-1,4-digalacturonate transport system permease protein
MSGVARFLTRRQGDGPHGTRRVSVADVLTYGYLIAGVLIMFGPVAWLVLSSFKTPANLLEFPPTLLPLAQDTAEVDGYAQPLPLYDVTLDDGTTARLAQVRRVGLVAQMVDPAAPGRGRARADRPQRTAVRSLRLATENYTESFTRFNFATYLRNSVVVTVAATLITLVINSMAAFALSKYRFRGRNAIFLVIISTLMIPISVILVPVYLVITQVGWVNNLWGVIIPGAATPTGVFLLRQYMLTIPDELLDSGRIDGASSGASTGRSCCRSPPPRSRCWRSSR